ncbi:MAG TPA: MFS transporter [Capillimicrobium sp.]|jgi:EmrB/QacA subfamily drug resistance transporter
MSTATPSPAGGFLRYAVLWPLVPAMAMVMIDFTIVSISVTTIQDDLGISSTAAQWTVTAYALATAAFVALGGRLGDILGHRRIVTIGVIVFALASLMCGLVPDGDATASEAWLIAFRVIQGIGGALLIPSATVLVLNAFPTEERGKGLSLFFIVTGLFTALGPIAGSYLTEYWTWRAIFWINVPVAIFALLELRRSKLVDEPRRSPIDTRGAVLIVAGMALSVLGIQQSTVWGWDSPATIVSIVVGLALLAVFWRVEQRTDHPLIDIRQLKATRGFALDNLIMFLFFTVWLAIFLFGSIYFQISAGQPPSQAGFSILAVFYTFFGGSRLSGVWLDKIGPRVPVAAGLLCTGVGLAMWAHQATELEHINVLWGQLVTGFGLGLVMSAINTDALNRVPAAARGQASGVLQTTRNFGSAIGVALLGTIILSIQQSKTEDRLTDAGVPAGEASSIADSILSGGQTGPPAGSGSEGDKIGQIITSGLPLDYAEALQAAFYVGAGIMLVAFVIALLKLPRGRQEAVE